MNDDTLNQLAVKRRAELLKKRRELLSLPPQEAVDRILDEPQPTALVHAFPEEDLFFLIHDIGPEDALPLLSLASGRQLEYILDMETWGRDRIDFKAVAHWLNLMMKANPARTVRWLMNEKSDLVQFYLFHNIEIRIREHDQDPSDFGEGFTTDDDVFYTRLAPPPFSQEFDETATEKRDLFVSELLQRISAYDHRMFQNLLLSAVSFIPAEVEEELYRLRNVRLAEKGFLPVDEAVGIYQPLAASDVGRRGEKVIGPDSAGIKPGLPLYPVSMLEDDNRFTKALTLIDEEETLQDILIEFAGLANRIIAADLKTYRSRDELREVVEKGCGYLSIGIESLSNHDKSTDDVITIIQKYPLDEIFRVGYGRAMKLKWRAQRWLKRSWFKGNDLPLSFWDEEWMGVLGGLFIKRPLFFDNYETGVIYREFKTVSDIKRTEKALNAIIRFDDIFSLMDPDLSDLDGFLTFKNVILTHWARQYSDLPGTLKPLSRVELESFFNNLFSAADAGADTGTPRTISPAMRTSFLDWAARKSGLETHEISDELGHTFEALFQQIESEYGSVAPEHLDPRYIQLFIMADEGPYFEDEDDEGDGLDGIM